MVMGANIFSGTGQFFSYINSRKWPFLCKELILQHMTNIGAFVCSTHSYTVFFTHKNNKQVGSAVGLKFIQRTGPFERKYFIDAQFHVLNTHFSRRVFRCLCRIVAYISFMRMSV